jgi:argininosuccinate lyase
MGLLTTLKGLPLTYNRDMQEDKEGFFDAADTLAATLDVFRAMLPGMKLNEERVSSLAEESQMLATDLADYLVAKGMPFREAHGIVRELSRQCDEMQVSLSEVPISEYKKLSELFDEDVNNITAQLSASARDNPGGTAPVRVAAALVEAKKRLEVCGHGF